MGNKIYLGNRIAHLHNFSLLGSRQIAHLTSGDSSPDLSHTHSLAGSYNRTRSNGSSSADMHSIENGHSLSNQAVIINSTSVDNRSVIYILNSFHWCITNHRIVSNHSGKVIVHMNSHIISNVSVVSNLNSS